MQRHVIPSFRHRRDDRRGYGRYYGYRYGGRHYWDGRRWLGRWQAGLTR